MKKFLLSFSARTEFWIVLGVAFGPFLLAEGSSLIRPVVGPHHNNLSLLILAAHELILGALLIWFLRVRGWTLQQFGLGDNSPLGDAGAGLALFVVVNLVWFTIWNVAARLSPQLVITMARISENVVGMHIPAATAIVLSIANGAFEEFFVAGYLMTALERFKKS